MTTNALPRTSVLARISLGIGASWYVILGGFCLWYWCIPFDRQGWDGLILIGPAMYGWIPFSIVGGLMGIVAYFRIRARPVIRTGQRLALIAVALSLLHPLMSYGLIFAAAGIKTLFWERS